MKIDYNSAMSKLIPVLFFSFFIQFNNNAQTYTGDLTLTTQAEVDSFNYTQVTGNLTIDDNPDATINNLNGLSELTAVGGNLTILDNNNLADISGLSNLISAKKLFLSLLAISDLNQLSSFRTTEGILIGGNQNLTNIDALLYFDSLKAISIGYNPLLTNLHGLSNLTYVDSVINISNSDGITNLDDLSNLKSVGFITVTTNPNLLNIDGLSNLSYVKAFNISGNDKILNVDGLMNVTSLPGSLDFGFVDFSHIAENKSLKNINGLINLTSVNHTLVILNNHELADLNGLSNLTSGNLRIDHNPLLYEFCGLYNYAQVNQDSDIVITGNGLNPTLSEIREAGACNPTERPFICAMHGPNESESSGGGMIIINAARDTLEFWIRICDLKCPLEEVSFISRLNARHIKNITSYFVADTMGSYVAHGVWTSSDAEPLTPDLAAQFILGYIYTYVFTAGLPYAEMFGQVTSNKPVDLFANLDGSQETPPVMTMGSGEGHFTLSGDGDSLEYSIMFGNLSGPVAASHFHKAAFGFPGPVVRGFTTVGDSMAEGVWTNMDAQPLTPQLVADLLGCFIYANIHTQQHPGGEIRGQLFKTETMMKQYMTIWAAENDADANQNSRLNFYSLAEGKQFLSREGDITGYNGEKRIADLTIDIGGNIYFLNNTWTSMLYRIKASAIDLDGSTPVYAKQIGRTRTFPDEKLVWLSHIQFIRGKLYGLDNKTNKLYEINQYNAYVKELADLSSLDKQASGFALGADGNVYLLKTLDNKKSEIWKFDQFPGNSLSLVTGISSLDILESFASHPNGKLYAADKNNLYEIDLSQRTVGVLQDHQVNISAMDFDTYTEKTAEAQTTVAFTDISSVTSVDGFTELPTRYSLSQNYPNPFNPNTIIKYSLPEAAFVRLKVYNSLGELVKTLVSETKNAGYYQVSFDASSLSSGMYIYKIEAGSFVQSRKMILLK